MDLSRRQKKGFWFLAWIFIHTFSLWLMNLLWKWQKIDDFWVILFGTGLGITLIATAIRSATMKRKIIINLKTVKWFLVHTFGFWLMAYLIVPEIPLENYYLQLLIMGFGIAIIGQILKNIQIGSGQHKMPTIPWWLIVGIIIVLAIFIKVPYNTKSIEGSGAFCKDGKVMAKNFGFMGTSVTKMQMGLTCVEYKSSQCRPICKENKPMCQCEANIWDIVLHSPGDWLFGGLFS